MVIVRMQRHGANKKPFFHIVVADHHRPCRGKFIERIGFYDPKTNPTTIEIKEDRLKHWYGHGAQLSSTVAKFAKIKSIDLERLKTAVGKK